MICDCTVVTLFAGFFMEANLNYIIEKLHKKKDMIAFLNNSRYPGLQDKLAWYYNEYVAKKKAKTRRELFAKGIKSKLRRRYPGFAALYKNKVVNSVCGLHENQWGIRLLTMGNLIRPVSSELACDLLRLVTTRSQAV